jgi:hypothetical protein
MDEEGAKVNRDDAVSGSMWHLEDSLDAELDGCGGGGDDGGGDDGSGSGSATEVASNPSVINPNPGPSSAIL